MSGVASCSKIGPDLAEESRHTKFLCSQFARQTTAPLSAEIDFNQGDYVFRLFKLGGTNL